MNELKSKKKEYGFGFGAFGGPLSDSGSDFDL